MDENRTAKQTIHAGKLQPWTVGELPQPPGGGWRQWLALLGPGVLIAGASVGSGEWLLGPAVSAQYGGTLLWVATLSIVAQVFCNLEMMRYALYCGEPITVGFFRTPPRPVFWAIWFLVLDIAAIWPYNASNAAVPLAAALGGVGHLPSPNDLSVRVLGYAIFLLAFVPVIFGGAIYRMLERAMLVKLVLVLGYLTFIALFMVSARNAWEVTTGFFRFGAIPLRAETVIVDRHFNLTERDGITAYTVKGTVEHGKPAVMEFVVKEGDRKGVPVTKEFEKLRPELRSKLDHLLESANSLVRRGKFYLEDLPDSDGESLLTVSGRIGADQIWQPDQFTVAASGRTPQKYTRLEDVPDADAARFREVIANQGVYRVNVVTYTRQHGRLPDHIDWAILAAFASIAGAGGMTNTMFSNFARDKGWGMGANVGAIPSAVGGRQIALSHVGEVFRLDETSLRRWRGWVRHILKDQLCVWLFCSVVGMALPCMLSLEFIRNVPVSGNRVAALAAEGMADRYPTHAGLFWILTLLCGFLILAPGQIISGDQISRRWTDIIWTSTSRAQSLKGNQVKNVYYTILATYCVWGLFAMWLVPNPITILKIGAGLQNVALGWSAWHALYVNRTLLPRELRPNLLMQVGTFLCGVFFLGISGIVVWDMLR